MAKVHFEVDEVYTLAKNNGYLPSEIKKIYADGDDIVIEAGITIVIPLSVKIRLIFQGMSTDGVAGFKLEAGRFADKLAPWFESFIPNLSDKGIQLNYPELLIDVNKGMADNFNGAKIRRMTIANGEVGLDFTVSPVV